MWLLTVSFLMMGIISQIVCDKYYRLDGKLRPSEYEIIITPHIDTNDDRAFTFDGEVTLKVSTHSSGLKQIQLHSEGLEFSAENVSVREISTLNDLKLNDKNGVNFDKNFTFVFINLESPLNTNTEYEIHIVYRGTIRKDNKGLYRSSYVEKGITKWLLATHMEPYHTRKVFPCFDEPEFKAKFNLIIDRPEHYSSSLTNTKLKDIIILNNGYIRERFQPTPVMSSYLVSFLVSEFENGGKIHNDKRQFGIWVRPDVTNQTSFAFEFGQKVVEALSDFTGIDYYSVDDNLNLNHVGVPGFQGAMENWGLIDYSEMSLLYDDTECGPDVKTDSASVIAHETAHQWFGNLVTCHWWSDTWLNEGFATYFEDYTTALVDPSLGADALLVTGSSYTASMEDETNTSSPLTFSDVNSPSEISSTFKTISYKKGGTVIRMIHHLIGDEAFRRGILHYLKNGRFSVVTPENLYMALDVGVSYTNSLSAYPGYTVANVMGPWVRRAGHPVLHVSFNNTTNQLTLVQKRFYRMNEHSSDEVYPIPVTYTTQSNADFTNTKPRFILDNRNYTFGNFSEDEWIIFNIQDTGYYRVNYDEHLWKSIGKALKGEDRLKIHPLNRAKIIMDIFEFAYAEYVSFSLLFEVLDFLSMEMDYSVWQVAIQRLMALWNNVSDAVESGAMQKFILNKMKNVIMELGYEEREGDSFMTMKLRDLIVTSACRLKHTDCIHHATSTFKKFRSDGLWIAPSMRPVVYCQALKHGTAEDFQFLEERLQTTNHQCEASVIRKSLLCSQHADSLNTYMVSRIQDQSNQNVHLLTEFQNLLSENPDAGFPILQNYYAAIKNVVGNMQGILGDYAKSLTESSAIEKFEEWLTTYCAQCTSDDIASAKNKLLERETEMALVQKHRKEIASAVRARSIALTLPTT